MPDDELGLEKSSDEDSMVSGEGPVVMLVEAQIHNYPVTKPANSVNSSSSLSQSRPRPLTEHDYRPSQLTHNYRGCYTDLRC